MATESPKSALRSPKQRPTACQDSLMAFRDLPARRGAELSSATVCVAVDEKGPDERQEVATVQRSRSRAFRCRHEYGT